MLQYILHHSTHSFRGRHNTLSVNSSNLLVRYVILRFEGIHIVYTERQDILFVDSIYNGVGVEFIAECLLCGFQFQISTAACVLGEDRCARETEDMVFLEVLGDGVVHLTEIASVALVKYYHHPLLEDRMVLVLLYEDGEFLYGGDDDTVVVITAVLILVFQLSLKDGS